MLSRGKIASVILPDSPQKTVDSVTVPNEHGLFESCVLPLQVSFVNSVGSLFHSPLS